VAELTFEFPALALFRVQQLLRPLGTATNHFVCVPFDRLSAAVGSYAQQHRFGQRTRVAEVAGRVATVLDGSDPLLMMTGRRRNERVGAFEVGELLLGQKQMAAVIGKDHSLAADE